MTLLLVNSRISLVTLLGGQEGVDTCVNLLNLAACSACLWQWLTLALTLLGCCCTLIACLQAEVLHCAGCICLVQCASTGAQQTAALSICNCANLLGSIAIILDLLKAAACASGGRMAEEGGRNSSGSCE